MKTLGMDAEPEEIRKLLNDVDTDGNGTVTFDEFLVMMNPELVNPRTDDWETDPGSTEQALDADLERFKSPAYMAFS